MLNVKVSSVLTDRVVCSKTFMMKSLFSSRKYGVCERLVCFRCGGTSI